MSCVCFITALVRVKIDSGDIVSPKSPFAGVSNMLSQIGHQQETNDPESKMHKVSKGVGRVKEPTQGHTWVEKREAITDRV